MITEEKAKAAPKIRRCHTAVTLLRNANAEPRAITPNAAQVSGIHRVEATAPNSRREAGPHHDQHEDQPDVVGLPDRADRVLDQRPLLRAAPGPAGHQVPEPGAEVGPAEQRVGGHADPQDGRGRVGQGHVMLLDRLTV